jgi:hypothetical protein
MTKPEMTKTEMAKTQINKPAAEVSLKKDNKPLKQADSDKSDKL